jgi:alkylation response protein AidB-like acyl-CoA dehydrogenase
LILTAIIAGILRNVVSDAIRLVRGRGRTYAHAAGDTPAADPLLQQVVGQLASQALACEALVLAAAEAQEAAFNRAAAGTADFDLAHRGSLLAAQAKVVVDELASRAAAQLFDVGGSSAIKQSADLDRHWRNIRTLASHNPVLYKARAIGDYLINGTSLPSNGFF